MIFHCLCHTRARFVPGAARGAELFLFLSGEELEPGIGLEAPLLMPLLLELAEC